MSDLTARPINSLLWNKVLEKMGESMSKRSYETWIAPLTAVSEDEESLIIKAENDFAKDWVEVRYKAKLLETICEVTGRTFEIKIISPDADRM